MKATAFKESNFVIGGGRPDVNDLTICVARNDRDYPGMLFSISKYKLSPEELEEINRTGELHVCIMGHPQPPLLPTIFSPFIPEYGYRPAKVCMKCGTVHADDHLGSCLKCGSLFL